MGAACFAERQEIMSYKNGVVSVGTTATLIATPSSAPDVDGILIQTWAASRCTSAGPQSPLTRPRRVAIRLLRPRACLCPRLGPHRRRSTVLPRALPPMWPGCTGLNQASCAGVLSSPFSRCAAGSGTGRRGVFSVPLPSRPGRAVGGMRSLPPRYPNRWRLPWRGSSTTPRL